MKLECFSSLDELPTGCTSLFAATDDLFSTETWYRATIDAALSADVSPCFVVCTEEDQPVALFPMQLRQDVSALESLTTCYSCLYRPLLRTDANAASVRHIGFMFGGFCRAWPTARLDALPDDWTGLAAFLAGVRDAGVVALRFDHFGAWHLPVEDLSWDAYLAARPGQLQETIRRRTRKFWSDDGAFTLVTGGGGLESAIQAYDRVYTRSWKTPEPFPAFNPMLMRRTASLGLLRLGLLLRAGQPIAAQFWLATAARGVLLKLVHDEAYRALSPGTVLTALMIRHLLEHDHVAELDFGRGDDPYKKLWTGQRRQRIGLVLVNRLRWRGMAAVVRHLSGKLAKSCRPSAGRRGRPR